MDERDQLNEMKNEDLVAYRNILLIGSRAFQVGDVEKGPRHLNIVESLLTDRGVHFETKKLLNRKS